MSFEQRGIKKVKAPGMVLHTCWLIGPGLGLDDIEEVACMNEESGFCWMISSDSFRKLVIDLLFPGGSSRFRD
jgi:hypothetical protein